MNASEEESRYHSLELQMNDPSVVPRFVEGLDVEQKSKLSSFTAVPWSRQQNGGITYNYQEWRIQQNDAWANSQLQRGDMIASENWTQAAKEYQQGLQAAPDNIPLLLAMGKLYHENRLYEKARPYFEKILSLRTLPSSTRFLPPDSQENSDFVNQAQLYLQSAQQILQSGGRKQRAHVANMTFKPGALQDASVERSLLQHNDKGGGDAEKYPLLYSDSETNSHKMKSDKEKRKKRKRKYSNDEDSVRSYDSSSSSSLSSVSSYDRRKKRKKDRKKHKHKRKSNRHKRRRKQRRRDDSDDEHDRSDANNSYKTDDSLRNSKKRQRRRYQGEGKS